MSLHNLCVVIVIQHHQYMCTCVPIIPLRMHCKRLQRSVRNVIYRPYDTKNNLRIFYIFSSPHTFSIPPRQSILTFVIKNVAPPLRQRGRTFALANTVVFPQTNASRHGLLTIEYLSACWMGYCEKNNGTYVLVRISATPTNRYHNNDWYYCTYTPKER